MTEDERSAEARAVAEHALTLLLSGGAPTSELLIVLGGLVPPTGCSRLRAVNLRGTGNVERDHRETTLDGPDGPVRFRIAALAGYLLSKAAAARTRGAEKDYYDLAYVLLHNHAGGPGAAAAVVNVSDIQPALAGMTSTFVELRERFRNDRAHGPIAFAQESLKVIPEANAALLAADAAAAVNEFLDALEP